MLTDTDFKTRQADSNTVAARNNEETRTICAENDIDLDHPCVVAALAAGRLLTCVMADPLKWNFKTVADLARDSRLRRGIATQEKKTKLDKKEAAAAKLTAEAEAERAALHAKEREWDSLLVRWERFEGRITGVRNAMEAAEAEVASRRQYLIENIGDPLGPIPTSGPVTRDYAATVAAVPLLREIVAEIEANREKLRQEILTFAVENDVPKSAWIPAKD